MKRFSATLLVILVLFSQTELHQLLKLPTLIQHFTEHRALNHDLSLMEFLAIHYVHPNQNDADHDRDMQLPFKSTDCVQTSLLSFFVPYHHNIVVEIPALPSVTYSPVKSEWIPSIHSADIWQPPKNS